MARIGRKGGRMEERYLSLVEACEVLGKSERTLYRWIKSGKLRAYKPGRDYEIPVSAIEEMREKSVVRPKALASPDLEEGPRPKVVTGSAALTGTVTLSASGEIKRLLSAAVLDIEQGRAEEAIPKIRAAGELVPAA